MKAQAAGAMPVVIPSGGMDETVECGPRLEPAPTITMARLPPRVYEEWEELLIFNLRDLAKLEPLPTGAPAR